MDGFSYLGAKLHPAQSRTVARTADAVGKTEIRNPEIRKKLEIRNPTSEQDAATLPLNRRGVPGAVERLERRSPDPA